MAADGSVLPDENYMSEAPVRVHFGPFELDEVNAWLHRDGQPVVIAPKPFAVLCMLVRQPGALITKNALLDAVWGHRFVSDSVLKTAISELRKTLDDDARQPRFIETVSRRGYRFVDLATQVPDGEPVRVGESTEAESLALPLVGRDKALARVEAAWQRALSGQRAVVWVAGDPGVGKTALVDYFVSSLDELGATARGSCVEQYGAGEPYLPVLEALGELCRMDTTASSLLRSVAPTWLLQLPWLSTVEERDVLRRELAGVGQERMLREMGEFFDRYTEHRPLLLMTDDVQWSDRATIELMDHIARRRGRARLMWLTTFRLAEVIAYDHPLKALRNELRLHGLCEEIVLDPFSEQEVSDYVSRLAPDMAAEPFIRELYKRTEGLPLFVTHVMSDIIARTEEGLRSATHQLLPENQAIPDKIVGFIGHYAERLATEQRLLLEAAAVCGLQFRIDTLAAVLERDASSVASMCNELARGQLWLRELPMGDNEWTISSYGFRHSLFREVLYDSLGVVARTQLHRRTGVALERDRAAGLPVTPTELAIHYERGGDPLAAGRFYAEAAESLLHISAAEVMRQTEHALDLIQRLPRNLERDSLELTLSTLSGISISYVSGIACNQAKDAFARAHALLDAVPEHRLRATLLHLNGYLLCLRSEYDEALALAERAEARWRATNDPVLLLKACTIQGEVHFLRGRPRIALDWIERGLAAYESLHEEPSVSTFVADPRVTLLGMLALQLLHLGLVEQARDRLREARARARDLRQGLALSVAIWHEALVESRLGEIDRVRVLADDMQAIADEFAFAQSKAGRQWMRGWVLAQGEDPHEGYRLIRQAFEADSSLGMRAGGSEMLGYATEALVKAGDWSAAQGQLDEALQLADELGERVYLPQLFLIQAAIADARGESDAARASILQALAEAREQQAPWLELIALLKLCDRSDAKAPDRRALARLLDALPETHGTDVGARARALLNRK
jgi:DNA-binding winged helix-turn-helix (wHTH) protein/tetratricopeptide (TPR) repeat protein